MNSAVLALLGRRIALQCLKPELKLPYRDGTTHVIFEPLDFIARLAALVPKPQVNLTRFHGVFAPNSGLRAQVTPGGPAKCCHGDMVETASERRGAMTWVQRLKRVFRVDIETRRRCGGRAIIIANIEDPRVIRQVLDHLDRRAGLSPLALSRRWPERPIPTRTAGL